MKWFRALFGSKADDPLGKLNDPDFGQITYDGEAAGIWQSEVCFVDDAERVRCGFSAIPGDPKGPFCWARIFLLQKKQEIPRLWEMCTLALEEVCDRWQEKALRRPVLKQFVLTSISMSEDFQTSGRWNVAFESEGEFWVFVEVTIVDDNVEGHTCDT